jgi:hypothetical protein
VDSEGLLELRDLGDHVLEAVLALLSRRRGRQQ